MTLEAYEFLRRFCMHILPPQFVKMRHYGFLANNGKKKLKIEQMKNGKIEQEKTKICMLFIETPCLNFYQV
jgi:hypothetical protein